MVALRGLAAAAGIAIGRAVCVETKADDVYRFPIDEVDEELDRLRLAIDASRDELESMGRHVGSEMGEELGGIFEAHALLLEDASFVKRIERRICDEKVNAEWAVLETVEDLVATFSGMADERFRDRGQDIQAVGRALIRSLQGIEHHDISELEGDVIVVADDLTPSDAVRLGRRGVKGFAIETGGRTSHTTIIAHSLNIPLVSGVGGVTRLVDAEDPVIVDGSSGVLVLHPTPEVLDDYRRRRLALLAREAELVATRVLEAESTDGVAVRLMANIDLPEEVAEAQRFGAAGIGLYRSEFLYIERSPELPSEEDHYATYRALLEAMAPHPVIVRTYDLGGRKLAREVMHSKEENPVLGLRGIRLTMARPEIFRIQLRGLLRAGCHGHLWVMIPLVSSLDEVRRFRGFLGEIENELERDGLDFCRTYKLGVMIEVPSAALIARHLAREVDFFSIGTNDLIQYSMAVDRNNEHVSNLYAPLHPGLLRLIDETVTAARGAGIEVSVCGEMASDRLGAAMLLGLGVRRLSVSPRAIPEIKALIRSADLGALEEIAREGIELAMAGEVEEMLVRRLAEATGQNAANAGAAEQRSEAS